jgi:hypothetical protein
MEAPHFNNAINKLVTLLEGDLQDQGFTLKTRIENQEDSGDLVSSESIEILFENSQKGVGLRFFLCCGKGDLADYVHLYFVDAKDPSRFISASRLSADLNLSLHERDFNGSSAVTDKLPTLDFLEFYIKVLRQELSTLLAQAQKRLAQGGTQDFAAALAAAR